MSSFAKVLKGLQEVFGTDEAVAYTLKAAGFEDDGGPGSGNFGHKGRPGLRGGSGKGGGKGSGKAMRTGSKETGYSSFTKTAEFKKLTNLARLRHNKNSVYPDAERQDFWRDVASDSELDKALRAQHQQACPGESYSHYVDRMFNMLVERVDNEKSAPSVEKALKSLNGDEKLAIHAIRARWGMNPTHLMNKGRSEDKRDYLEILGDHADWSKRMLDRNFKHLDEQEKKDLNALLDKHPWGKDPRMAKIPNEKDLYETESPEAQDYYNALKAKALGIGRVFVPERPKGIETPLSKLGDWMSKLSDAERKYINWKLDGQTMGEFFSGKNSAYTRKKILDTLGSMTGWDDLLKSREFTGLNEQEEKDLNYLLDHFKDGDHKSSEENLYEDIWSESRKYYDILKAKALGIEGIDPPERPKEIDLSMNVKPVGEAIEKADGGYVHTTAGDANRAAVKSFLSNEEKSKNVFGNMPYQLWEHQQKIIESVDTMDDRTAELVARTIDKANLSWIDQTGTCCYYTGQGRIEMRVKDLNGKYRSPDDIVATFWHEYGHFLDDANVSKSGITYRLDPLRYGTVYSQGHGVSSAINNSKQYREAATKDIDTLLAAGGISERFGVRRIGDDDSYQKLEVFRKSDGKVLEYNTGDEGMVKDIFDLQNGINKALENALGYDKLINYMQDRGAPEEIQYSDYVESYYTPKRHIYKEREKYPGAKEAYLEARKERDRKWDEWVESIGGQDAYFELAHQRDEGFKEYMARKSRAGYITDCIDEAVNGMFGLGAIWGAHTNDYYRERHDAVETSANIFSLRVRNSAYETEFMDKVIPNISKLFTQAWRANYE